MAKSDLFHMTFLFWVIMDAVGNIPVFVSLLKDYDTKRQMQIIMRELLIALGVMILFLFFGQGFFSMLNIKLPALQLTGGIILFMIAINMIFAKPHKEKKTRAHSEPIIVPLAIPAIAGPGILATITLYGGPLEVNKLLVLLAIFIAWLFSIPPLLFSPYLKKLLGENGLIAAEQLLGYLIVLISVQMAISGVQSLIK